MTSAAAAELKQAARTTSAPLVSLRGIGVNYGAVTAVADVDLDLVAGEIVALCGDNGAGKSSLVKVISGAAQPSRGALLIDGEPARFSGPQDALRRGVATIYQELALAPRLAIYQNVFLGAELTRMIGPLRLLDKARMMAEAKAYLARLAVTIDDMRRPVEKLSGGQRQAIAIARALRWNANLVIMDEPTAALGVRETAQVHDLIRRLAQDGRAVLLISHSMPDVAALARRVVIMKHGRKVIDRAVAGLSADDIGHMIASGKDI
ncbi:MAG: ABC transporter ATP-binding protein [Rhizobiales bacterium 65-9]|nr:sugar ABC transporter ATP-binding protein [Hyphomicrobiales bacterium]OJY35006.1 MAG: ABC transporter ATP-binding protein [Rhizobiales bacterium 65-9]